MAAKKFEIQFLQDYFVKDSSGKRYSRGKSYKLLEPSAAHFINRKVAVTVPADGPQPDGVNKETAQAVNAKANALAAELAEAKAADLDRAKDELAAAKKVLAQTEKAAKNLATDATKDEKAEAKAAVKQAKANHSQAESAIDLLTGSDK